jgi:hypothetical protein
VINKLLLLILLLPFTAFSQLSFENTDTLIPELGVSGRSMALGNAFTARTDDAISAFYNPAGLGTVRKFQLRLSELYFDNDADYLSMVNSGNFAQGLFGALSVDGTRQLLLENPGDLAYSRFNFMPNLVTRYFSVGFLYSQQSYMTIAPLNGTSTFEYIYRQDQAPYLAFNVSFLGGVIKLGLTGFYLYRKELNGQSPANQIVTIEESDFNKGQGYFGIAGFKLTFPTDWLPTLSATYQNIVDTQFDNFGAAPVTSIPTNLTAGFSISPQIGQLRRLHFEANYVDALNTNKNVSDIDRVELGLEYDYDRSGFIRIGWLDGYISGGIGYTGPHLTINLSTYGVQATPAPGEVVQDRRYVLSMSYGI